MGDYNGLTYFASSSSIAFLICEVVVVLSSLDSGITRVSSYSDRGSYKTMQKLSFTLPISGNL